MIYKEKLTDENYSLLKGLHHTKIAMEYFEDVASNYEYGAKQIMLNYAQKCKWIIDNIRHRLPEQLLKEIDKEISDSLFLDSIEDKVIHFSTKQREDLEEIIELMAKGELIQIINQEEE